MDNWTAGYVANIGYTYGYYPELNPLRTSFAFLNAGIELPCIKNACELGFGQGLSANIHAAANSGVRWHGTDFNPSQAGFAQSLANASGSDAHLYDQAFAEFAAREDLPEFEYIGLHGIWSWISEENRTVLVDFIRRKLAVGGILYMSYNTLPGWSGAAPIRELMTQHALHTTGSGEDMAAKVNAALDFTQKVFDTKPIYCSANPQIVDRFAQVKTQNRNYLAHEYFNRDWHPMYFSDAVSKLAPAKVQFACSANYLDHVDEINLSSEQQHLLSSISDTNFKQSIRDYMVNQQFRKDYWVKGSRKIDVLRQSELIRATRVLLAVPRESCMLKVQGSRGEATLLQEIYTPILNEIADHKIRTVGDIEEALKLKGIGLPQLFQGLLILVGIGSVVVAQDEQVAEASLKASDALNLEIMLRSRATTDIGHLVSPVTGGGISVARFSQLFLLAQQNGKENAEEMAAYVWSILSAQGQTLVKDNKPLSSSAENLTELKLQAETFLNKELPILKCSSRDLI